MLIAFKEYVSAFPDRTDLIIKYRDYVQNGSFPYILNLKRKQDIRAYLESIYTAVVLKNIVVRKRISDVAMLESVISYMFDNIGNLCSATKIANTMTSAGRKISVHTVESYLSALTVMERSTLERELAPLQAIRDHNAKYLLTMDFTPLTSHNGIKQMNVLDWLLK